MSIHFISGKPRGGKSLYGVKLVIDELVHGSRTVITNLAFKLPELNEYLQKQYPDKSVDLFRRLILLDDDEIRTFFTKRPHGFTGPTMLSKQEWKEGKLPDYRGCKGDGGVFYAIDEVHIAFNARAWMDTGADVLFYLSQHGKLGDTVLCITQHINNVDKQFRSVTQDYTYIKNLSKARMGMFRLPGLFVRRTYAEPATATTACMETGTFKLDVAGIANTYDTSKGVGIHGDKADKKDKPKGLPFWIPCVIIPALLWCVYKYGPSFITGLFSQGHAKAVAQVAPQAAVGNTTTVAANLVSPESHRLPKGQTQPSVDPVSQQSFHMETNQVYCVAKTRLFGYWQVSLSDGQEYREGDLGLDQISRQGVVIFGRFYPNHPALIGESSFRQNPDFQLPGTEASRLKTSLVLTNL